MKKMNNAGLDSLAVALATFSAISERYLLPLLALSAALIEEIVKALEAKEAVPLPELKAEHQERELIEIHPPGQPDLKVLDHTQDISTRNEASPKIANIGSSDSIENQEHLNISLTHSEIRKTTA